MLIKGIRRMVIGLRDNNGIVNKITPLSISDIEQRTVNKVSMIDCLYFCIDSIHGLVNLSLISFFSSLIFSKNMSQLNIHWIASKFSASTSH